MDLSIKTSESQIQLTWNSTSNDPAVYFNVEKSMDGHLFHNIAIIKNDNHSILSYTDKNMTDSGKIFYRIAQIDITGHVQYSKIVTTEIINKSLYLTGFISQTNKTNFSFFISVRRSSQIKISLFTSTGDLIRQSNMQLNFGITKVDLLLPLSTGVYYLNVSNGDVNITRKIIKL